MWHRRLTKAAGPYIERKSTAGKRRADKSVFTAQAIEARGRAEPGRRRWPVCRTLGPGSMPDDEQKPGPDGMKEAAADVSALLRYTARGAGA